MNKKLLIQILEIPTFFCREHLVKDFLISYFEEKNYKYHLDKKGNLYVHKGKAKNYPCVCSHLDSVHTELEIKKGVKKRIVEKDNKLFAFHPRNFNKKVGLGGDDLSGVYLCLEMLDRFDTIKAAFFVEEEFGQYGAWNCDREFLKDVGYFIEFDGPTNNWYTKTLRMLPIYSNKFHNRIKHILERENIDNFSDDPVTDIIMCRDYFKVCSCNLPAGYFNYHTNEEYVDLSQMDNHILRGRDFISALGNERYSFDLNKLNESKKNIFKVLKNNFIKLFK